MRKLIELNEDELDTLWYALTGDLENWIESSPFGDPESIGPVTGCVNLLYTFFDILEVDQYFKDINSSHLIELRGKGKEGT